jgi:ribosomal-protein-serine acetyltransferase
MRASPCRMRSARSRTRVSALPKPGPARTAASSRAEAGGAAEAGRIPAVAGDKPVEEELLRAVPEALDTGRLTLRCPRAGDGLEVNTAVIESIAELRPWMHWAVEPIPLEQTEINMRAAEADFIMRKSMRYLVFLKGTPTLVGTCGLHHPSWTVPSFEIGYWARTRFAGNGYITEAVTALTEMAFNQLGARRMQLVCASTNVRSAAVARRTGYQLEGILRNAARHHITGALYDEMVFSQVR